MDVEEKKWWSQVRVQTRSSEFQKCFPVIHWDPIWQHCSVVRLKERQVSWKGYEADGRRGSNRDRVSEKCRRETKSSRRRKRSNRKNAGRRISRRTNRGGKTLMWTQRMHYLLKVNIRLLRSSASLLRGKQTLTEFACLLPHCMWVCV